MTSPTKTFFARLQEDRKIDVAYWKKHPELKKQFVDDLYSDRAHVLYELLQNAEYARARHIDIALFDDRFTFRHDGEDSFTESNIEAITDVSKTDKPTSIRRFGIGFKSVFKFTDTPHIHSGAYSFRIIDFVCPDVISPFIGLGADTYFEFPFNKADNPSLDAFTEIKEGLRGLDETTLLFLSNIASIRWEIGKSVHRKIERFSLPDNHVEIRRIFNGETIGSSHFLLFDELAVGMEKMRISIAFGLELLPNTESFNSEKPLASQMKIVSADPGRVSILLPAENEKSGLRFHLNAPFDPTLSRDSIKNTPSINDPLFQQLANLTAASLHKIRELGLLNAEFLEVLPNPQDKISNRYKGIQQSIIEEMNDYKLTPAHCGLHAAASRLLQAKASLKTLLSEPDIEFLVDYNKEKEVPPVWAIDEAGGRIKNFLDGLNIREWGIAEFVGKLVSINNTSAHSIPNDNSQFIDWLSNKSLAWHQQLYALLSDHLEDTRKPSIQSALVERMKSIRIVRLSDGTYRAGKECFFPSDGVKDDQEMPRVDRLVFMSGEDERLHAGAKKFLIEIGVREFDQEARVQEILEKRYRTEHVSPDPSDLERFIEVTSNGKIKTIFDEYFIFESKDGKWRKPSQMFLDLPFLETDLSAYHEPLVDSVTRFALADRYQNGDIEIEKFVEFARAIGVQSRLEIAPCECNDEHQSYASGNKCDSSVNKNYEIEGLAERLKQDNQTLSRLVWKTVMREPRTHWFTAKYSNNKSHKPIEEPSKIICVLRDSSWVPQSDGRFVRPAKADKDLLPNDFEYAENSPWLNAIRFGEIKKQKTTEQQLKIEDATRLGTPDDERSVRERQFSRLPEEEQIRLLEHSNQKPSLELPDHSPRKPQRSEARYHNPARQERVAEIARNAPNIERPVRKRKVRVNWETKKDARTRLRRLNTNDDDQLICQVCCREMPFKKNNGSYYFAAVECVLGLDRELPENHIALCPLCAAMFWHANSTPFAELKEAILVANSLAVPVTLAGQECGIHFTEIHLHDLRTALREVGR